MKLLLIASMAFMAQSILKLPSTSQVHKDRQEQKFESSVRAATSLVIGQLLRFSLPRNIVLRINKILLKARPVRSAKKRRQGSNNKPQPRASEQTFQPLTCQLLVALVLSQILGMSDVVAKTHGNYCFAHVQRRFFWRCG